MSDRIHLKELILPTVIGVPDAERELPQSVSMNATLFLECSFKDLNDDISQTVDYFELTRELRRVAARGERKLIETLAEDLAEAILMFEGVRAVTVEIQKFILPNCGCVSVEIDRSK